MSLQTNQTNRHIKRCGKAKMRAQRPYCNHTESRRGDLIRRHVAKLHPANLAMVIQRPSMIREIEERSPVNVKSDTETEQESLTSDWTMTLD